MSVPSAQVCPLVGSIHPHSAAVRKIVVAVAVMAAVAGIVPEEGTVHIVVASDYEVVQGDDVNATAYRMGVSYHVNVSCHASDLSRPSNVSGDGVYALVVRCQ